MHELRIGDISRLTGRTTEHIRRCEKAGIIPKARRDKCWRYWFGSDLPGICAGLSVPPPPTAEERVLHDVSAMLGVDLPDDLEAACERLTGVIRERIEALIGKDIGKDLARS